MRFLMVLIGVFVLLPVLELYILIQIAYATSWIVSVGLVITTGVVGGILAKQQGAAVLQRLRDDLRAGHMPADALFDGALVLVSGAFLLTPGLITDTCGFILVIPYTRKYVKHFLKKQFAARWHVQTYGGGPANQPEDIDFEVKNKHDDHD